MLLSLVCQFALAQRYLTTLGLETDLKSVRNARGMIAGDFNGDGFADIMTFGGPQLSFHYQEAAPMHWHSTALFVGRPVIAAAAARANSDQLDDVVLVVDNPPEIQVYISKRSEKCVLVWKHPVPTPFENVLVADVNGDRRPDILFFGKKQLGISVMAGRGGGTFREITTILPEYSLSALSVTDVNGDAMNDVIASNWVSNQLLLFSGFGKMRFSDPSVIECPGEPSLFSAALLDTDRNVDLIVAFKDQQTVQTYSGDGFGGFHPMQTITLENSPVGLTPGDINGDGRSDIGILSSDPGTLTIALNNGNGVMEELIPFSAGKSPAGMSLLRSANTDLINAAVLDSASRRIRLLYSSRLLPDTTSEQVYAVGVNPLGVIVADIDGDGWDDIVVANAGSKNVSLLVNRKNGTFEGQVSLQSRMEARALMYVRESDSVGVVLLTDPGGRDISIAEVNTHSFSHSLINLPCEGVPGILSARIDRSSLNILALERRDSLKTSLVEFEQIAPTRFIERSLDVRMPYEILDAAPCSRYDRGDSQTVASLMFNARTLTEEVRQSRKTSPDTFDSSRIVVTFDSVKTSCPGWLWCSDMNNDEIPDIITNLQEPVSALYLSLGKKDGTYAAPKLWIEDIVNIGSREKLKIIDVNGDGIPDLVMENDFRKILQVYLNQGDGRMILQPDLLSTLDIGAFALGDVDHDGVPELVVTSRLDGTVRVISFNGR